MTTKTNYKEDIERVTAVFETNQGSFEAELYAKECPQTAWNFINLAEGRQVDEKSDEAEAEAQQAGDPENNPDSRA